VDIVYRKSNVDYYVNSLRRVLFGERSKDSNMKFLFSKRIKDIFHIFSILNIHLLSNVVRVYKEIGLKNLFKVFFIHAQITDEMAKINKLKSKW
jgi:hypothetical protein